jgi:fluoroquinolone resistance protein
MAGFNEKQKDYYSEKFEQLKLPGQEINSMVFEECVFNECDFSEATFARCKFIECHFLKSNLSVVKFDYSRFNDVFFEDCKIIGVDWTRLDWPSIALSSPIKFLRCNISDTTFFGLGLREISIEECKAHDVDFREGDFSGANFINTDFANSMFNGTDLTGADFTEAINFRIDINHNKITKAIFSRHEALNLLDGLDIELVD